MEALKEQDAQVEAAVNTEAAAHVLEDGEHVEKEEDMKLEAGEAEAEKEETAVPAVMTDIEKKKKRAERFGTDLKISEAEKRKMRAARFNDGTKNGAAAAPVAAAPVEVKGGADAKVAVPESVKAALMEAESLKRKARAERFGSVQPEAVLKPKLSKDDVAPKSKLSEDEEAKKKARMARFAVTAK